jgi:hypothetical protein
MDGYFPYKAFTSASFLSITWRASLLQEGAVIALFVFPSQFGDRRPVGDYRSKQF